MPAIKILSQRQVAQGVLSRISFKSQVLNSTTTTSVYIPKSAPCCKAKPALYWLSGLTCTDENFVEKAGAFHSASNHRLSLVIPDTSPRGDGVANDDAYDLGQGAGFYLNATEEPWKEHYQMYDFITKELPDVLANSEFNICKDYRSISGHSMGGHGALTIALKDGGKSYSSVSAFAPIVAPAQVDWGKKAFTNYLGSVENGARDYDATNLMLEQGPFPALGTILIDQGTDDEFLQHQLKTELFENACNQVGQSSQINMRNGYDHSYFFISSFIDEHISHASKAMKARAKSQASSNRVCSSVANESAEYDFSDTQGKTIQCKAAVAFEPKIPLSIETINVAPPKKGEVRVKVVANALCHTDVYTWEGSDPEGLFPCVLGHEAGAIVESVGEGVTSVKPGDHVVPAYTPQCNSSDCIFCMSTKTNLCPTIRSTQGQGFMPDGTSRISLASDNTPLYHFMGCSTMAEYAVLAEISCAKISKEAPLEKMSLFGCGISTGLGAVWKTCEVESGSSVAVFGLGAVGLSVIQAAKLSGARRIFAIDINNKKFPAAVASGATDCINSIEDVTENETIVTKLIEMTDWGVDYTFDCTGNTNVMRDALEAAHRGWGVSCVIGVAASGQEISTRPFQLVTGRTWKGTAFGGWKSRSDVPVLVDRYLDGDFEIDHYITHEFNGVEETNKAFDALHSGDCLRAIVKY